MAENGRLMRVEVDTGAGFAVIAGAQEESFTDEVGEINITNKDSNGYRRLLEGGIRSLSISISGISEDRATVYPLNGVIWPYRITWENGDMLGCNFQMGSYQESGPYENSPVTFTCELRSDGEPTFTPAAP